MIFFIGSVFSPWYARARAKGHGSAANHVSVNVALYGGRAGRWAMTERGSAALETAPDRIGIGRSALTVGGDSIVIDIDEWTVPVPRRLKGRIVLETGRLLEDDHVLDTQGRHVWRPLAPFSRAHVDFDSPGLAWSGPAYVDSNRGDEPVERGFRSWSWSRATRPHGTTIFYDVEERGGARSGLAFTLHPDGSRAPATPPDHMALPGTLWRVGRTVRSQRPVTDARSFEDTPFYTRTAGTTVLDGAACPTICESVDLDRFAARWVQMLLPFRMPRIP